MVDENGMVVVSAEYSIPEANLEKLASVIAKLNKRAAKIKAQPVTFSSKFDVVKSLYGSKGGSVWLTDEEAQSHLAKGGKLVVTGTKMAWFTVTIVGVSPKYDGWEFVATLEPVVTADSAENLIKAVPGKEVPKSVALRVGECDQCKKKRKRTETFVVQHDSGEFKVVGRNCVGDFLGGLDPHNAAAIAQWLADVGEAADELSLFDGCGSGGSSGEMMVDLLSTTAAVIGELGWKSKAACESSGTPTAWWVMALLNPWPNEAKDVTAMRAQLVIDDSHVKIAEEAVAWALALPEAAVESNSYLSNLQVLAKCEWCSNKNSGLAVSMVAAYLREVDKLKEAARKAARPVSNHLGQVGEKLELVVTVEKIIRSEGMYGVTGIHKMVDEHGNDLTWFASGSWLNEGETVKVKGTVKKHDEFNGRKQTVLTRVSVVLSKEEKAAIKAQKAAEDEAYSNKEKVW